MLGPGRGRYPVGRSPERPAPNRRGGTRPPADRTAVRRLGSPRLCDVTPARSADGEIASAALGCRCATATDGRSIRGQSTDAYPRAGRSASQIPRTQPRRWVWASPKRAAIEGRTVQTCDKHTIPTSRGAPSRHVSVVSWRRTPRTARRDEPRKPRAGDERHRGVWTSSSGRHRGVWTSSSTRES